MDGGVVGKEGMRRRGVFLAARSWQVEEKAVARVVPGDALGPGGSGAGGLLPGVWFSRAGGGCAGRDGSLFVSVNHSPVGFGLTGLVRG